MIIKKIGCQYFLNFGEYSEIFFEENQKIISVIGSWANEPKRSNRSGKSSFLEMIVYALYGKTRAKKELDLINKNHLEKDMFVEIEFDNGYIIKRGRTSNNEMILELTGFEGADKKVVQEEIVKLVGMNYDDFIMTSFFMQGDIHTFMEAGASSQKQIMSKWLEKDYWKIFEKNAKNKMDEISKEIIKYQTIADGKPDPSRDEEIKDNIITLNSQKEDLEEVLKGNEVKLKAVDKRLESANKMDEIKELIRETNREIRNSENLIKRFENDKIDLNERLNKSIKNEKRLNELSNINEDSTKELKSEISNIKEEYKEINSELSDLKSELKQLKNEFEKINSFDSICPVTKTECKCVENIKSNGDNLRKRGVFVNNKIKKLDILAKEIQEKINIKEDEMIDIKSKLNEIKVLNKEEKPETIKEKIEINNKSLETQNKNLKNKNKEIEKLNEELEKLNNIDFDNINLERIEIIAEINVNKDEITNIINNVAKLKANLEVLKAKRIEAIKAEKEIKESTRMYNLYKYISFMFSKNGIPFNQIETAFEEIEEEANLILQNIGSDISIEFTPDKELNQWESNCLVCNEIFPKGYRKTECPECGSERQKRRKDELNIIIKTGDNEMDFSLESGGGKVLISLAIRLAFVRLLQRRNGVNLKIVVFDEIFGMLDEVNRNYVLKLMSKTLLEEFDFSQVFAISHEEEIRDIIPEVIKITKYEDHSEFAWN